MICQLCKSKVNKVYKVIKKIKIYECLECQVGFTSNMTNLMRSHQTGNALYDFKSYKKDEDKLKQRFERLAGIIKRYKKSGSVLDVGAGFGLFSSILAGHGRYKIDIIEPNLKPYYLRPVSYTFYKATLEKFLALTKHSDRGNLSMRGSKKRYDLIILMDVVEHLENPLESLKRLQKLLSKDGVLVIQTPNYISLMARICRDWSWWMVEDHKFFFSPRSLRLLLKKAGFETEHFTTYEDWEDFKKNLDGNFTWIKNEIARKIIKGLSFAIFLLVYFTFREMLWEFKNGALMFVIAKNEPAHPEGVFYFPTNRTTLGRSRPGPTL